MRTRFFSNCLGVFQGGGCRGAAYVGAYRECIEAGITFSELVGASAGSIIAVLIGAGASPDKLEGYIKELDFRNFLADPIKRDFYQSAGIKKHILQCFGQGKLITQIIEYLGVHSSIEIEKWLEAKLRELTGITTRSIHFEDLVIPTTVTATDIDRSDIKVWGSYKTPDFEVSKAVRASCSIPFFFQPVDNRYVDSGLLSNLPSFIFNQRPETHFSKVLAFCLVSDFESTPIKDIGNYFKLLSNTIVDGSKSIQTLLQKNVYQIKIPTKKIKATDFDKMNDEVVDNLIENGKIAVKQFVSNEYSILHKTKLNINAGESSTDTKNFIVDSINRKYKRIIISGLNTRWVYEHFPLLLSWMLNGTEIKMYLRQNNDDPKHGDYRQRLLDELGVDLIKIDEIGANVYIFDPENDGMAIVENDEKELFDSMKYSADTDGTAVVALANYVDTSIDFNGFIYSPKLLPVNENEYLNTLKTVNQYSGNEINISIEKVSIDEIIFLTKHVKGFKLRQIESFIELYNKNDIKLFMPTKLEYKSGKATFVGIPVLEEINGRLYVLEGNTRFFYCYKKNVDTVYASVVRNVTSPLPSDGRYKINEMLITDSDLRGKDRYDKWDYSHFRKIEESLRHPETSLI